MKSIAVFCGSNEGFQPAYQKAAQELGQLLAREKITVIYGGGKIGLMGILADAALEEEGEVVGVLPDFLSSREIAHDGLTELIIVESMHDRKMKMHERCDGVIVLPGGYGTLEELFEFITWAQLGLHHKPIGLVNVGGFYDSLLTFLDEIVKAGFMKRSNREMLLQSTSSYELLGLMQSYEPPKVTKWISSDET